MSPRQVGETIFDGVRFNVERLNLPGRHGATLRRDAVVMADAVVVLPLLDDGRIVMIRNERFAVGEVLWELCAGTIEPGEAPETCAARELIEETGYQADRIQPLIDFYTCPGICTERMYAFAAHGLTHVGQRLEENERIEVEVITPDQSMQMIRRGEIRDAKTIATLLYHAAL